MRLIPDLNHTQLKDIMLPFIAPLHHTVWNYPLLIMIGLFFMVASYFTAHMMDMAVEVHLHSQYALILMKNQAGQFTLKFMIMDYLTIGSNGFAQVGRPDFSEKNRIEMRVLMQYIAENYPVPDEFAFMGRYKVKWFSHDFGMYSEIVFIYDDSLLYQWEEDDPEKFDRFWNWFNDIESVNLESDYLNNEIRARYQTHLTKIT